MLIGTVLSREEWDEEEEGEICLFDWLNRGMKAELITFFRSTSRSMAGENPQKSYISINYIDSHRGRIRRSERPNKSIDETGPAKKRA